MKDCSKKANKLAVWAVTSGGVEIAEIVLGSIDNGVLFCSSSLETNLEKKRVLRFTGLRAEVEKQFFNYSRHLFIMATGITVRVIARLLETKLSDPAVAVMDERGRFCISLVSGHIGGANDLCRTVAKITCGTPVITTATDVNRLPAIDTIAVKENLFIENPEGIKRINMAILNGETISVYDPYSVLKGKTGNLKKKYISNKSEASVVIDDVAEDGLFTEKRITLRPASIVAGIGCNRGTSSREIIALIEEVFVDERLALKSLYKVASIDIKSDEDGILETAEHFGTLAEFFDKDQLNEVTGIENPSSVVEKYTGARSVCEAAAIAGAKMGKLIVAKRKTKNVTLALARKSYT